MILSRLTNLNRKRKPVIASYIDTRKTNINIDDIEKLKFLKQSPISYLVTSTANCTVDTPLGVQFIGSALRYHAPLIQPIANLRAAWSCGDTVFPKALAPCDLRSVGQLAHEWSNLNITQSDANGLERSTRLQSSDPRWYTERSNRITASNFGLIMRRKKDINETFMKNTFLKKEFSSSSTSYGKANEIVAKQMYIRNRGNHLHEVGLIVNPDLPFLGATPDGIMCEKSTTAIIEIKCPYSVRDMSICEACETRNDFS